jgi:nucleoside triphosphate pyrophosphatase
MTIHTAGHTVESASADRWLALASQSPRRLELLRQAGFDPVVIEPGVDDSELSLHEHDPAELAMALAYFKAAAGEECEAGKGRVTVGADTFVMRAGVIMGKPIDEADAARMLDELSDCEHEVITGVAIVDARGSEPDLNERLMFADTASVTVGALSTQQRCEYLQSGLWQGKAGAYNLVERLDAGWPIEYEGDPTTIMGLPMRRLTPILLRLQHSDRPVTQEHAT